MKRRSQTEWFELVRQWASSGLPRRTFATKHALDPLQLSQWKWRASQEGELAAAARPAWVEVVASRAPVQAAPTFVVELEGGVRIVVPADFDAAGLQRLLAVLSC